MGLEAVICVVGFVVLIYFGCRPKPNRPKKKKDNLTDEIHVRGLPPAAPWDIWIDPR